jgi:uroporphyrinogen-III decarboxylase
MDFSRHNAEVRQVWEAYNAGRPLRVPMVLTSVQRIWVLDPELNTRGVSWQQYLNDPRTMFEVSLAHRYHVAHHIPQDAEMGIPADHWDIWLEFGNVYEESWFGCQIVYPQNQIATTTPCCAGDQKEDVFQAGIPAPFAGFMGKIRADYEQIRAMAQDYDFHGRPVRVHLPVPASTDGPLTVANGIRGTQIFEDMLNDEAYYHRLMDFVTTAIIERIRAWRTYLGLEIKPERGFIADDTIQFLSVKTYREKVLPYHKRLMAELFGPGPHGIHLCGNVQRHFPTLMRELNMNAFDTGFPLDFTTLRDQVGESVEIQGGVPVGELLAGPAQKVYERTRSILQSGVMRGGRFILKEANDLAPCVPPANMQAMYAAAHDFGNYEELSKL